MTFGTAGVVEVVLEAGEWIEQAVPTGPLEEGDHWIEGIFAHDFSSMEERVTAVP